MVYLRGPRTQSGLYNRSIEGGHDDVDLAADLDATSRSVNRKFGSLSVRRGGLSYAASRRSDQPSAALLPSHSRLNARYKLARRSSRIVGWTRRLDRSSATRPRTAVRVCCYELHALSRGTRPPLPRSNGPSINSGPDRRWMSWPDIGRMTASASSTMSWTSLLYWTSKSGPGWDRTSDLPRVKRTLFH
jgi:hypothetical protein